MAEETLKRSGSSAGSSQDTNDAEKVQLVENDDDKQNVGNSRLLENDEDDNDAVEKDSYMILPLSRDPIDLGEEEDDCALPETGYSLIYTAACCSLPYWAAIGISVLQLTLLLLALMDICDVEGEANNFFRIPPGISGFVRAAQVLGIILIAITVTVQGDFRTGLLWLCQGYSPSVQADNPHAGCTGWFLAGALQILVGLAFVCLALLLLLQSTEIIGMVLNFAATEFLSLIDELFFLLATKGFMGGSLKRACAVVHNSQMPTNRSEAYRRPIFFCVTLVALFVPASFVWRAQLLGNFVCATVLVQIAVPTTTQDRNIEGVFRKTEDRGSFWVQHPVYENQKNNLRLAYCRNLRRWTIQETSKDCEDEEFVASSIQTSTFDVVELASEPWLVWNDSVDKYVPTTAVVLWCLDCSLTEICDQIEGV